MRRTPLIVLSAVLLVHSVDARCADRIAYPGASPGPPAMMVNGKVITAGNAVLSAQWRWSSSGIGPVKVIARQKGEHGSFSSAGELFQIVLTDGTT